MRVAPRSIAPQHRFLSLPISVNPRSSVSICRLQTLMTFSCLHAMQYNQESVTSASEPTIYIVWHCAFAVLLWCLLSVRLPVFNVGVLWSVITYIEVVGKYRNPSLFEDPNIVRKFEGNFVKFRGEFRCKPVANQVLVFAYLLYLWNP